MWMKEMFGVDKPIIALLHLDPLPGDVDYCGSMQPVIEHAKQDLMALQNGGVDGILIANEFYKPGSPETEFCTVAAMAYAVGYLKDYIKVPYGVNVVLNGIAAIDLAAATDAQFIRSTFTEVSVGSYGIHFGNQRAAFTRRNALDRKDLKMFYKINPEGDVFLADRSVEDAVRAVLISRCADALCVSGSGAGNSTSIDLIREVKKMSPETPVFANTGVSLENVEETMKYADGACIGTYFKEDGKLLYTRVDEQRVRAFMEKMKEIRAKL